MKRIALLALTAMLLLTACQPIQAPAAQSTPEATDARAASLPIDPAVRVGQLDNGLTYYIRHNDEPMNRAELYLAIDAGSILEDDDQLGLAHFLEHMLFNGTENFPGMGVVDFLEGIGMEFGPDVNAYTSFDETVYTIQVPTDNGDSLAKGFQVLSDWAARATLDAAEVDKERGVIVEEWRLRQQTAGGRINQRTLPFILGDESRYAERQPIGDMDVVQTAPTEALRRYYENWYRPDLMSVIAVGDFDVDQVEALIRDNFAVLANPANAPARTAYEVPRHDDTRYLVVGDPEETVTRLAFIRKRPAAAVVTTEDLRGDIISDLFYIMLNNRFDEIEREPGSPFLSAGAGQSELVRPIVGDVMVAQLRDDAILAGLDQALTEVERVRLHGFTASEIERARADLLNRYQVLYNERDNQTSSSLADDYLDHFLVGEAIPSIDELYSLVQQMIPQISLDEVNDKAADLVASDNRVLYVTAPQKADAPLPTEADLAAVADDVLARAIDPYTEDFVATELMAEMPAPAAIVDEQTLPDLGVTVIELENGVRVFLKPTDFRDDEIVFTGVSLGGSSLVADDDFPEASTIDDVVNESGVGPYTQTELVKLLSGKSLSAVPYIRELAEGIEGKTTVADLETTLQLIHLYFTNPRADESAFEVFKEKERTRIVNREQDPNAALQDALIEGLYGDTIRRGTLPVEEIDNLDLARGFEIYQDRFGDAGDFDFVFVGSFELDEMKGLAQSYLGSLPAAGRTETWRDVAPDLPVDVVTTDVYKGEGERSIVQIVFNGPVEASEENKLLLNALAGVLDIRLREEIREERGGAYSTFAYAAPQELPDPSYLLIAGFATDPNRVEELVQATFETVEDLRQNGPLEADVAKVKAQQRSTYEENLEGNAYWLQTLKDYLVYGDDDILDVPGYGDLIDGLTAADIQQAAQEWLDPERYVKVVLLPEAMAPAGN